MTRLGALAIFTLTLALFVQTLCAQKQRTPPVPAPDGSDDDVHLVNVTLKGLISQAYQVAPQQVIGPARLGYATLDLVSHVPEGTPPDQTPRLLQIFLAQEFKLAVHPDKRAMRVFVLEVAPGGPQLDETPAWNRSGGVQPGTCKNRGAGKYRPAGEICEATSMTELADRLQKEWWDFPPVLDRTGLTGIYDFILPSLLNFSGAPDVQYPFQFTVMSVQDQLKSLGLTVEQRKETVKVIVVDHVEKARGNRR